MQDYNNQNNHPHSSDTPKPSQAKSHPAKRVDIVSLQYRVPGTHTIQTLF